MNEMLHVVWTWLRTRDERGATAVEYGMLVALIAAVIVGIVATVGTDVLNAFTKIANALP
jgi:pilus assembly protein Flp/PilA